MSKAIHITFIDYLQYNYIVLYNNSIFKVKKNSTISVNFTSSRNSFEYCSLNSARAKEEKMHRPKRSFATD